jgi:hypothetical protein
LSAGLAGFDAKEYTPLVSIRNANRYALGACRYAPGA